MSKKKAVYIDIDGTLARFHDADKLFIEAMWTPGFYVNLKPFESLVEAVRLFKERNPDVEVFTLSAVLDTDPPFVIGEKNEWLDKYLPVIDKEHRIFTKAGEDKSAYIDMDAFDCTLLDDYNKNLYEFEFAGGHAIKFHNDVNHRGLGEFGGSKGNMWTGDIVHHYDTPYKICRDLEELVLGKTKDEVEIVNELASGEDMYSDFVIEDDVLIEYLGHDSTVVIPEGVREIDVNAFWNNKDVKHVVFPESLEKIGSGAFAGVDLQQLILPEGLREIHRHAFEGCHSLQYVKIPASVYYLSTQAFDVCQSLKSIQVDFKNEKYFSQDGLVFNRNSDSSDITFLHRCPTGFQGDVKLYGDVVIVGPGAFMNCNGVTEVSFPDGVRVIQDMAFAYCDSLYHVDLPKGLAHLNDFAFVGCENLVSIHIPDGISLMGHGIFEGCHNLNKIVISDEALVDYCEHYNFLDEVFMLPCFEELAVRYESLMKDGPTKNGVDEVLADATGRAGKPENKSNGKEFEV